MKLKTSTNKYNYIVSAYWHDHDNHLCIYAYGNQVQYGTEKDAKNFLKYVKKESPDKEWQILWIKTDRDNY